MKGRCRGNTAFHSFCSHKPCWQWGVRVSSGTTKHSWTYYFILDGAPQNVICWIFQLHQADIGSGLNQEAVKAWFTVLCTRRNPWMPTKGSSTSCCAALMGCKTCQGWRGHLGKEERRENKCSFCNIILD